MIRRRVRDVVHAMSLRGVSKVFPGAAPVVAVAEATLNIEQGQYVAIVGSSGSGKSTLLSILGLMAAPTSGEYCLFGESVSKLDDKQRSEIRASRIGFLFQSFALLEYLTVSENVMLAGFYQGVPESLRRRRTVDALERVSLHHRIDASSATLSGGEKQRVALARALAGEPGILLCDEPTGNLDSTNRDKVLDTIDELNASGLTVVVVTHDPVVSARARINIRMEEGVLSLV